MVMLMLISNIFLPEIDKKSCFECGSNEELHFHHPVPKSRGGTRTIPLCEPCHSKAHHRDKNMTTSKITTEALARLRQEGRALGAPGRVRYGWSNKGGFLVKNEEEQLILQEAIVLRSQGYSYPKIADHFTETGRYNRKGNRFTKQAIRQMFVKRENNKMTIDIERQDGYAFVSQ